MLIHIKKDRKEVLEFANKIIPSLSEFFNTTLSMPKFRITKNPKIYARNLLGIKRLNISAKTCIWCFEDASAFYNPENRSIFIPKFVRAGSSSFEVPKSEMISTQAITHELIHHFQHMKGGYSTSDFFDETCDEMCAYSLAGGNIDPSNYHDYFTGVSYLYYIMESTGYTRDQILIWCRDYNVSNKKNDLIKALLKEYVSICKANCTWKGVLGFLERWDVNKIKKLPYLSNIDTYYVQDNLYKLFENYRII